MSPRPVSPGPTVLVQARFPVELHRQLVELAAEQEMSVAGLVRRLARVYVQSEKPGDVTHAQRMYEPLSGGTVESSVAK